MSDARGRFRTLALGLLLIALGAVAGWWWARSATLAKPGAATSESSAERPVLYWYDPMSPQHHFDRPGKSPYMDMDLIPKYASNNASDNTSPTDVTIDAQVTQNIGMREAVVERIALASVIEATGLIAPNERDVTLEQVRSGGLVERVWPLAPGDVIEAGQPLVEVLVPEWSAAQAEFLVLRASADSTLVDAARARLRLLGMSADVINELEETGRARQRFILKSSRAGILESLDVRSGMTLTPGQMLARIQGISSVWLEVAVPESRTPEVQAGGLARVQMAAYPGQTFSGQITAVLPTLTTASRTLRVRIELPNPLGQLRSGMSAQVRLESSDGEFALSVPTETIIRTGKRALVIAVQGEGKYAPVEVELGREIDDRTVIAAGLQEGQRVVASAQFLLDSEASLSGVITRAASATPAPTPAPQEDTQNTGVQP
jgi:membrane fusion protein, copper/silver efflux system